MDLIRKLRFWLPAVGWAGFIFILSSMSFAGSSAPGFIERYSVDKAVHLVLYGILGGTMLYGLRRAPPRRLPRALLLAILLTSAYGVSDEWHQSFVPGRDCNVWDWVADTCGAALAVWVYDRYESRTSREEDRNAS